MILDGKSLQEYSVNSGDPQGSILGPTFPTTYWYLPDVFFNIAIYADDATLYSKCDQVSNLWQQVELTSELESDLLDTLDWGSKWLVDFNTGKTQLVSFDQSNNTGAIDVKMDGSVLEKKHLFKCWRCLSFLNWIGALITSIAKTTSKKIEALIRSIKFLSPDHCVSINLSCGLGRNTVTMPEVELLAATWKCQIS